MVTARNEAQKRLSRAWASAIDRKPANYLRLLLAALAEVGTPRKVYQRIGDRALDSGSFRQIEEATATVQGELNRRRLALQQVRDISPNLRYAA